MHLCSLGISFYNSFFLIVFYFFLFWHLGNGGLIEGVQENLLLMILNTFFFFFKCLVKFSSEAVEFFKLLIQSFLIIGVFRFSVSSCLKFGKLCMSRNLSISCRFSNLLACGCF